MSVAWSRAEAAAEVSMSEDMIDAAILDGSLKAKKFGRRILIRPVDLEAFIAALPDVQAEKS